MVMKLKRDPWIGYGVVEGRKGDGEGEGSSPVMSRA
jgi:hypothetical protein